MFRWADTWNGIVLPRLHLTVVQETCWRKTMVGRWIILGQFPKEERSVLLRLDGLFDPSRTAT